MRIVTFVGLPATRADNVMSSPVATVEGRTERCCTASAAVDVVDEEELLDDVLVVVTCCCNDVFFAASAVNEASRLSI
jgi:hypothetical protein